MNKCIYDIRKDDRIQRIIDEQKTVFSKPFYIEKYGRYGTDDWWNHIHNNSLVRVVTGKIVSVTAESKSSLPVFEVVSDGITRTYLIVGNEKDYFVGGYVKLYVVNSNDVLRHKSDRSLIIRVEKLGSF